MMFRLAPVQRGIFTGLCTALVAVFAGCCLAQEQPATVSEPPPATNASEVVRPDLQEDLLKERLRDRIFERFKPGDGSMDAVTVPIAPQTPGISAAEARRLKERVERERSWAFGNEDQNTDSTGDKSGEPGANPDLERDTLAILKRQYQNERLSRGGTNQVSSERSSPGEANVWQNDPAGRGRDDKTRRYGGDNVNNKPALQDAFDPQNVRGLSVPMPSSIFSSSYGSAYGGSGQTLRRTSEQRSGEFRKLLDAGASAYNGSPRSAAWNTLGEAGGGGSGFRSEALSAGGSLPTSLPRMPTLPGYNPDSSSASSLSPALAAPASLRDLTAEQPRGFKSFAEPAGPPRRIF